MDVNVPNDQRKRQAIDSLAGYAHQAIATIEAWMRVRGDGVLLIEVAEDYAVVSRDALDMTQVKHVDPETKVTLGRQDARAAIQSLWQFSVDNPDRVVRLQFLTSAQVGHERGTPFGAGVCGIHVWEKAAIGGDVEALRAFLLAQTWADDLAAFLRDAPADELRERLFARLSWSTGAESSADLIEALKAKLRARAVERSLHGEDGEGALPHLVFAILQTILAGQIELTEADFEAVWAEATEVSVSKSLMRSLMAGGGAGAMARAEESFTDIAAPRLARREALVDRLSASLSAGKLLWLHGSSGLGKTRLAQLVAARSNGYWRAVRLRGLDAAAARAAIFEASSAVTRDDLAGFVLDDLPVPLTEPLLSAVRTLVRAAARAGAKLIVTAQRAPAMPAALALEPYDIAAEAAPYLGVDDVANMVAAAGGDPEMWPKILLLTCGNGHPQIVDARIAGLASRGWPDAEQLGGLMGDAPGEIADVRADVTLRLVEELDADSHQFLLRLSVLSGSFDRDLALALAEAHRALPRPGALFDWLVGPWVERIGADSFRLSPLLAQAGLKDMGTGERDAVRRAAIDHLIRRESITQQGLSEILLQASVARHLKGLEYVSAAVIGSSNRSAAAQACFALGFFTSTNGMLVPENPIISAKLRLAQAFVVLADPTHSQLETVMAEAEAEFAGLPPDFSAMMLFQLLIIYLSGEDLAAPPRLWMPRLEAYAALLREGTLPDVLPEVMNVDLGGVTPEAFFFMVRAGKIGHPSELAELFAALETADPSDRQAWFAASSQLLGGPPLFLQLAWSVAAQTKTLDATAALPIYATLAAQAEGWGEMEVAVECHRARAVLLDEFLNDSQGALDSLADAETRHAGDVRLVRSRATVLANAGRNAEAQALLQTIVEDYSKDEPLERALALQAAAIAAGKAGDHRSSAQHFREAFDASEGVAIEQGIRAGLLCDAAVAHGALGEEAEALQMVSDALAMAEDFDPAADHDWFAIQACGQVADWLFGRHIGKATLALEKHPGNWSQLQPKLNEVNRGENSHLDFAAQRAARLDIRLGRNFGLGARFERLIEAGKVSPSLAAEYYLESLANAIAARQSASYAPLICRASSAIRMMLAVGAREIKDAPQPLTVAAPANWDATERLIARAQASPIVVQLLLAGDREGALRASDRLAAEIPELGHLLAPVPRSVTEGEDEIGNGLAAIDWLLQTDAPDPDALVGAGVCVVHWLTSQSDKSLAPLLWEVLAGHWLRLVREQRFHLRMPAVSAPAIEAAVTGKAGTMADLAALILAGSTGAQRALSAMSRGMLQTIT